MRIRGQLLRRIYAFALIPLALLLEMTDAGATAQRTFVASYGSPANTAFNCSIAKPCRQFSDAIGVTTAGGEVIVLDSAGYGPVTITQSVSIIAPPGVYAGISVFSGDGVTLGTAGLNVTLRGLTITGLGGANGIHVTDGATIHVEDCTVTGFTATSTSAGINISAAAEVVISNTSAVRNYVGIVLDGGAKVQVSNSNISFNSLHGVLMAGPSNATTLLTVSESVASGNSFCGFDVLGQSVFTGGFGACTSCTRKMTVVNSTASHNVAGVCEAGTGAAAFVSGTAVSGNDLYGLYQSFGTGTLSSAQNNPSTGNGSGPTTGTITPGGVLY